MLPKIIEKAMRAFGIENNANFVDLRNIPNKDVFDFFILLEKSGKFVFHGTNTEEKFEFLEARQSNDASKESGNKKAVYADAGTRTPIAVAILNKKYLEKKLKTFITGWGDKNGKMIFWFTPNIYKLFRSGDPQLFSDGYIYVLDRSKFVNAKDAGSEWHSEKDQKPILSCRVSKKLARDVYILNPNNRRNVREYSKEEIKRIEGFNKK